ncbi:MAG TPA: acetate kinase [Candidatus Scatovivens faecipullorum]|nr:acetate kinase [Candidatus Scatovivens faecipullorum]
MKILVVNCGSSSLKYQLIDMDDEKVLAKGNFERIGEKEAFVTHKVNGEKYVIKSPVMNHEEALKIVLEQLTHKDYAVIKDISEIDAVGHRMVHGGELFDKSVKIDEDVIKKIESCSSLAPLHNPAAILGIRACQVAMPGVPMAVTFDTAFHQTMPKENYIYPIPYEYYEKYRIRKYGFHGTSHQYVSRRVAELIGKPLESLKIVTCHLGQGASICAIDGGKSIDTSMGLSPLGGIAMVTRSGDLDPSVVTEIMERENLSPKEMNTILNKKSGLYGITGLDPDFREIELASYEDDKPKAKIAIELFTKTIAQFVAKYAVSLKGIDVVVFTGGIGENQINIRKKICENLEWMGLKIDLEKNNVRSVETKISTEDSKILTYIIPTDEEMVIAKDTKAIVETL